MLERETFARVTNLYKYRLGTHWLIPAWWEIQASDSCEALPIFWLPCLDEPTLQNNVTSTDNLPAVIGTPTSFIKRV